MKTYSRAASGRFSESTAVGALTGWDIESYETTRRAEGVKPLTLRKEMQTLRRFLEYCERIEVVDDSLAEKVDPPDVPKGAQVDETMLRPERAKELIEFYRSTPEIRGSRGHVLLELAWYTGARLGALRGLDVGDFDPDEAYVRFRHRPNESTPLKNARDGERVVALPPEVVDIVEGYLDIARHEVFDENGREPLIASTLGRPSTNSIRAWMYRAAVPCLHTDCPHGQERETCEYLKDSYIHASKCPSSRSPH